jgi:hypothetical protein
MKVKMIVFPALAVFLSMTARGFSQELNVSGVLDSAVKLGADVDGGFMYGIEEYANIRIRRSIGGKAVFYGAFNCIAASGITAEALAASGGPALSGVSQNYAASLELERLYIHVVNERTGLDAGLMRLAFGYGSVFSPSDFFNPKNPLYPDARPRAILGGLFSFYPDDDSNLRAFAAAPRDPLSKDGGGFRTGISGERHFGKVSAQGLYAFESGEKGGAADGVHRLGASVKADVFAGFWTDMLYSLNPAAHEDERLEELSASVGLDYSPPDTHLYLLCEYLFSGAYGVTAASDGNPAGLSSRHYLYGMARYSVSDFTSLSLAAMLAAADLSFTPIVGFSTELFQGLTLTLTAQSPLDRSVFTGDSSDRGELGPVQSAARFLFTAKAALRF